MTLFHWISLWLWLWFLDRLVCLHYCAFRQAGSTLKYTHVHVLGRNDKGVSGIGHDDETPNEHEAHETVSEGGRVRFRPFDWTAPYPGRAIVQANFHRCTGDACPPGFRRIRCRCGGEEEWVCYTTHYRTFEQWYAGQNFTHQIGSWTIPFTAARDVPDTGLQLPCPGSIVLQARWVIEIPDCTGFGPTDTDNRVIRDARTRLQAAADRITCADGCRKQVTEIYCGWKCEERPLTRNWSASASVQWRIECLH